MSTQSEDSSIRATKLRLRNIEFSIVFELTSGKKVLPTDAKDPIVTKLEEASRNVAFRVNKDGISKLAGRIDEVSNKLEIILAEELRKLGTRASNLGFSGYPDLMIDDRPRTVYVEVKLAGQAQLESGFRSFYYQPAEGAKGKVVHDGNHILVGFVHGNGRITGVKIVDLSKIHVTLKSEWNTNNVELYSDKNILRQWP